MIKLAYTRIIDTGSSNGQSYVVFEFTLSNDFTSTYYKFIGITNKTLIQESLSSDDFEDGYSGTLKCVKNWLPSDNYSNVVQFTYYTNDDKMVVGGAYAFIPYAINAENPQYWHVPSEATGENKIVAMIKGVKVIDVVDYQVKINIYSYTHNYSSLAICAEPQSKSTEYIHGECIEVDIPNMDTEYLAVGITRNYDEFFSDLIGLKTFYVYAKRNSSDGLYEYIGSFDADFPEQTTTRPDNWTWKTAIKLGDTISYTSTGFHPVSADEWNDFTTRVNEFRAYKELGDYSFTQVKSGDAFNQKIYKQAVEAISDMAYVKPVEYVLHPNIFTVLSDALNAIE